MAGIFQACSTIQAPFGEVSEFGFAGASNYERGILSFKHSSADGQSAGLTVLPNGEQVNKYTIREPFTITALLLYVIWGLLFFFSHLTILVVFQKKIGLQDFC